MLGPAGCRAFMDSISLFSTKLSKRSRSCGEITPRTSESSENWPGTHSQRQVGARSHSWEAGDLPPTMGSSGSEIYWQVMQEVWS